MWSEARLHRWLARRPMGPALTGSHGHDSAVLRRIHGRPAICADACIEGVHFLPTAAPGAIGSKAACRALSDLAATAARPRALLLSLTASAARTEAWMRALIQGVSRAAQEAGAELVGGDLSCSEGPTTAVVTALGEVAGRGRPPGRDRARSGQLVLCTGPLGGSGLGRHLRIRPRLSEGRWLHERGATAMMDVSDGLGIDLARIAAASRVRIHLEHIPLHPDALRSSRRSGRPAQEHALCDGEDHELLATVPAARLRQIMAEAARRAPDLRVIGRVLQGAGLFLPDRSAEGAWRRWVQSGGWVHGHA